VLIMSLNNVIEIFLYVNPLGKPCYETEKMIESFSTEREETVRVRFIPLLNFHTIGTIMREKNDPSLENRNQLYTDSFQTSLAFQAASMQGKKKGRKFLMSIQEKVIHEGKHVSKDLFLQVAKAVKLDMEMFEDDLHSDFSKTAFNKDQKIAQEMDVTQAPSCVLYSGKNSTYGYRIDASITKHLLHGLCNQETVSTDKFSHKHLSLLQMV